MMGGPAERNSENPLTLDFPSSYFSFVHLMIDPLRFPRRACPSIPSCTYAMYVMLLVVLLVLSFVTL